MSTEASDYQHNDRVRDTRNGATGTVRIEQLSPEDARDCGYSVLKEVRWDNSFVAEELDLVRSNLARI